MITINTIINQISQKLSVVSTTSRLDAELLVGLVLQRPRAWLFTHDKQTLTAVQYQQLQQLMARRLQHEPIAYILEQKEFWGLEFKVTPDVLVPRPETEHIVEWVLAQFPEQTTIHLADLGTGCGAIALSLAAERPVWQIDATDQSQRALTIAKENAMQHRLKNVRFYLGNWCTALPQQKYTILISNPPYIAANDSHLLQLTHEPLSALSAGIDGLDAIRTLIEQAPDYLIKPGYLVLE